MGFQQPAIVSFRHLAFSAERVGMANHMQILPLLKRPIGKLSELCRRIFFSYNFINAGIAQLVERNLAKVEVESSRLFSRSKLNKKGRLSLPLFSFCIIGRFLVICGFAAG
jgi:hypothetical protein